MNGLVVVVEVVDLLEQRARLGPLGLVEAGQAERVESGQAALSLTRQVRRLERECRVKVTGRLVQSMIRDLAQAQVVMGVKQQVSPGLRRRPRARRLEAGQNAAPVEALGAGPRLLEGQLGG